MRLINKIKCFLGLHNWDWERDYLYVFPGGGSLIRCRKCGDIKSSVKDEDWESLGDSKKRVFIDTYNKSVMNDINNG